MCVLGMEGIPSPKIPRILFPRLFSLSPVLFKSFNMSEIGLYLTAIIHDVFIAFLMVTTTMVHTRLTQFSTKHRNIC